MAKTREKIFIELINKVKNLKVYDMQKKAMSGLNRVTNSVTRQFTELDGTIEKITTVTAGYNNEGKKVVKIFEKTRDVSERLKAQQEKVARANQMIAEKAEKARIKTEALARKQKFFAEWSEKLGVNTARVSQIMGNQGLVFDKMGYVVDKAGRNVKNLNDIMKKGVAETQGFRMELLGVMFAGMALYRTFGGLIRQQMELWGVTDMFSSTLSVVFAPLMEMLQPILMTLLEWFMNLPEPVQKSIGIFTLLAAIFGGVLILVGQIGLGLFSISKLFGVDLTSSIMKAGGLLKWLGGLFSGLTAPIIIAITSIVAIVIGMYLAWKENFLGMKKVVEFLIKSVKQMFGGLIDIIKGALMIVKGIFKGDFTMVKEGVVKIFKGLGNFLLGFWKTIMATTTAIIIGALRVVYGVVKVIIDGIGWIIGKAGKLFGFSGEPAFKLPSFQTGGIMPHNGLAYLHKGEKIIPANQVNNMASPTITINATVSNDYDVRRLADELKKYWVTDFERVSQGRSV